MEIAQAKELYRYLKSFPLFSYLNEDAMIDLFKSGRVIECDTQRRVIKEGQVQPEIYLVARGSVDVTVQEGGREVFISTIGEGQFFGEAGLFTRVRRTANVLASDGTLLIAIGRPAFLAFIQKWPKTGMQLLLLIIYNLLKKLRSVNQELAFERKFDIDQEDIDDIIRGILEEKGE
ncbi:MAG: cyclic nucleotide-binding domain-containing protein [Spirochaetales bacterium]